MIVPMPQTGMPRLCLPGQPCRWASDGILHLENLTSAASSTGFVVENQSSGEGKVSSQITMHCMDRDGARDSDRFTDVCRIAGGMIEHQWVKLPTENGNDAPEPRQPPPGERRET